MLPREHWPRAIRTNGHITINNAKMSKSTGKILAKVPSIESPSLARFLSLARSRARARALNPNLSLSLSLLRARARTHTHTQLDHTALKN